MKNWPIFVLLFLCTYPELGSAQQKVFDWVKDSNELVSLNPGLRQKTHLYNPAQGGYIKLDVQAQRPVTVAVVQQRDWDDADQGSSVVERVAATDRLQYSCVQQHVVSATYSCYLPASPEPVALILRDERQLDAAVLSQVGAALHLPGATELAPENDVRLQYYRWSCVQNCYPPVFHDVRLSKEKFRPSTVIKSYSLPLPEHDGEQIELKLKSNVPMLIAVVPSASAQQLYAKPDTLESVVAAGACQERGVQSMNYACSLSATGGPQSLVLSPEPGADLSSHSKVEIELKSLTCVANCRSLPTN